MERSRTGLTKADARNLGLLLFAVVLLWIPRLQGPIDLRWDAGVYYILGTSLAEGRGYRLLNEPGEIEAVQYPPLLPAMVAMVQKAVGTTDSVRAGHALRLLFFGLTLAYAAATYVLARQFVSPALSLLAGLLTSLHHYTVFLSDLCNTEIPYALVTVLFVLCLRAGAGLGAGLLAAAAFLLRTPGVALLGAWVGEALLRRQIRTAVVRGTVALVPLLLWQAHVWRVTHGAEYTHPRYAYQRAPYQQYNVTYAENLALLDPFHPEQGRLSGAQLARRMVHNALRMPLRLGDAVSVTPGSWSNSVWRVGAALGTQSISRGLALLARLILGLGVLAGLLWLARQGEWLIVLYVLASLALVVVTPWTFEFPRYLAPLAPFLTLAFASAAGWLRSEPRIGPTFRIGIALLVLLAFVAQLHGLLVAYTETLHVAEHADSSGTRARGRLFYHGPEARSLDASLDWLATRADLAAVLATTLPHSAFLRTGRRAVLPPREADPAQAQRLLDSVPVAYLIVDDATGVDVSRQYGEPVAKDHPALWELVYDRGARIYRRRDREPGP